VTTREGWWGVETSSGEIGEVPPAKRKGELVQSMRKNAGYPQGGKGCWSVWLRAVNKAKREKWWPECWDLRGR